MAQQGEPLSTVSLPWGKCFLSLHSAPPGKPKVGEPEGNLWTSSPKRLLQMGLQYWIFFQVRGEKRADGQGQDCRSHFSAHSKYIRQRVQQVGRLLLPLKQQQEQKTTSSVGDTKITQALSSSFVSDQRQKSPPEQTAARAAAKEITLCQTATFW